YIPSTGSIRSRDRPTRRRSQGSPARVKRRWGNVIFGRRHAMRDLSAGPRVLLKRLRELMAEPLEPQERLDQIVRQIAQNMVAEVCSVYVLRSDGILELYATEGLNPGAVHLAQLKMGQGLVGTIAASARPLNL